MCKGTFQKRFSGFCPLRGFPPPYPLNEQSFCQKTLSGQGGYPPPPLTDNHFAKKPLADRGGYPRPP